MSWGLFVQTMEQPTVASRSVRELGVHNASKLKILIVLRSKCRDFYGALLVEVEDEARFRVACPVDHLCTIFQCPNFQSQNIRGKISIPLRQKM